MSYFRHSLVDCPWFVPFPARPRSCECAGPLAWGHSTSLLVSFPGCLSCHQACWQMLPVGLPSHIVLLSSTISSILSALGRNPISCSAFCWEEWSTCLGAPFFSSSTPARLVGSHGRHFPRFIVMPWLFCRVFCCRVGLYGSLLSGGQLSPMKLAGSAFVPNFLFIKLSFIVHSSLYMGGNYLSTVKQRDERYKDDLDCDLKQVVKLGSPGMPCFPVGPIWWDVAPQSQAPWWGVRVTPGTCQCWGVCMIGDMPSSELVSRNP